MTRQPSQRFIPAYAGNSRQERPSGAKSTVHPRLRGELPAPIAAVAVMDGSSPLTRGTQTIVFRVLRRVRFIPAYAGNSAPNFKLRLRSTGSSPLTRGTQHGSHATLLNLRFIPAYAGNSSHCLYSELSTDGSSPLTRGTLGILEVCYDDVSGSSPLTRGTHDLSSLFAGAARFIPAYAGNSSKSSSVRLRPSVHPRLRGELSRRRSYFG